MVFAARSGAGANRRAQSILTRRQAPPPRRARAQAHAVNPKYTTPKSALDTAYGAKIAEYTTEKYFMTELVDHLPLSDKVPSPEKILGYAIGTPNKLTYTKDLYRYYRALADASPRVRVFIAPEKSEEGREQMLVLVSDEANLAKLDRYKEITAKLGDPRKLTETEAHTLVAEGKAVLLGVRFDPLSRNRFARDADGDGLSSGR